MSDQQSPVATESSESEAVEESSSEAKPSRDEDGKQLWKAIQAQTGFDSYQAYLAAYMGREDRTGFRPDLKLLWRLFRNATLWYTSDSCTIFDVSAHGDSPPKLFRRCHSSLGPELLAALCQPCERVHAQVVAWDIGGGISRDLSDKLGLGLRIDPQFFLALIDTFGLGSQHWVNDVIETRPPRPSHVVIHRAFATVVRQCPLDKPVAAPIILIACDRSSEGQLSGLRCVADQRTNNPPPFTIPSHPLEHNEIPFVYNGVHEWLHIYQENFAALAGSNPDIASSPAAIIAGVLMPLLQMDGFKIRVQFLALQAAMDRDSGDHQAVNHISSKLHHHRFRLRRSVEDSDDDMSHFERYISVEDPNYLPESSAYLKIKQETSQIHNEARRLDAEVRDYLQLVVGNLALEESRKSIELSNQQIVEGKRGV